MITTNDHTELLSYASKIVDDPSDAPLVLSTADALLEWVGRCRNVGTTPQEVIKDKKLRMSALDREFWNLDKCHKRGIGTEMSVESFLGAATLYYVFIAAGEDADKERVALHGR